MTCQLCGIGYKASRRNSKHCRGCSYEIRASSRFPENQDIRRAIRGGSREDVLDAIRGRCAVNSNGCWEWQGMRTPGGYGQVTTGRAVTSSSELTHRVAYEYSTGISPAGMTVHHMCANSTCCNPDHLQLATQRENTAEMFARRTYEAQIEQLRTALEQYAPDHPLLKA